MAKKKSKIPGLWYPLTNQMVQSKPFQRLTHIDKTVLLEFLGVFHYKKPNSMARSFADANEGEKSISAAAWVNSKFRICAYGFLYQVRIGGLYGHKPTVMGKCGRWQSLHRRPKNLARVDRLIKHYERIRKIPLANIKPRTYSKLVLTPRMRKRLSIQQIRNNVFIK